MLLDERDSLDHDALLLGQHLQNLSGSAAMIARDHLDLVAFLHMKLQSVH
jgi:hypothetical protein